jgi:hypothetical protein
MSADSVAREAWPFGSSEHTDQPTSEYVLESKKVGGNRLRELTERSENPSLSMHLADGGDSGQVTGSPLAQDALPAAAQSSKMLYDEHLLECPFNVAARGGHRVVDQDGTILTCSDGKDGQLRHRTAPDRLLPMQLGRDALGFFPALVARQPRVIHHSPVRKHEKHLQTIALLPAEGERDQPAWTAGDLSPRADHAGKEGRQMSVQFLRLGGAGKGFAGCEVVAVEILVPLAE